MPKLYLINLNSTNITTEEDLEEKIFSKGSPIGNNNTNLIKFSDIPDIVKFEEIQDR